MPFDCSFPTGYSYYLGKRSRYLIWITKSKLDELKKKYQFRQETRHPLCIDVLVLFLFIIYLLFFNYYSSSPPNNAEQLLRKSERINGAKLKNPTIPNKTLGGDITQPFHFICCHFSAGGWSNTCWILSLVCALELEKFEKGLPKGRIFAPGSCYEIQY